MMSPGGAVSLAGAGRVAATTTVAAARAADRPGLPDDTQVTRRLPGTSWHELYGYAYRAWPTTRPSWRTSCTASPVPSCWSGTPTAEPSSPTPPPATPQTNPPPT